MCRLMGLLAKLARIERVLPSGQRVYRDRQRRRERKLAWKQVQFIRY